MPGLGGGNPFPFELGGGPSTVEEIYDSMYQSVGSGIQAPEGTIVEHWRMARARGIAATSDDARASFQAFPDLSTDFLPVWEQILDINPPTDSTIDERQDAALAQYTRVIDASYPALLLSLTDLDPLFQILIPPNENTRATVPPRMFQDWNPGDADASGPPFNLTTGQSGSTCTSVPNYASDFTLYVLLDLPTTVPNTISASNQRTVLEAQTILNESLPAWVDLRVFTECGFILDRDLLDATAFCDGIISP